MDYYDESLDEDPPKYNKVTKDEVYKCFVEGVYNSHPIYQYPVRLVAAELQTSKYQVRKFVKRLCEDGLLKRSSTNTWYPEDGESLPYHGFTTTPKSSETEIHKEVDRKNAKFYRELANSN